MERMTVFGRMVTLNRRVILAASLALSLAGCGSNLLNNKENAETHVRPAIWQHQHQFVRIESQDRDSILVPANDHPANFSANLIRKMLDSLEVQFEGEAKPVAMFSPAELEILGAAVSRGLAQAGPREDVTFAIAGVHPQSGSRVISTGRLFVEKDRLNLIIGALHEPYPESAAPSGPLFAPGSRKYTAPDQGKTTAGWAIMGKIGMQHKTGGAIASDVVTRPDWLILNPTPDTFREATKMWEESAQYQSEQQKMHQKIEEIEQSIEQIKQTPASGAPATAAGPMELDNIEQRLQFLQQLKNKGLIDDAEFRTKKQELLDRF